MTTDSEIRANQRDYPFPVAHVDLRDGGWALTAHATMSEALKQGKLPGCQTPTVFGSWEDYYTWKALRTPAKP